MNIILNYLYNLLNQKLNMDFKKGEWKIGDLLDFDLEKASEQLDDKTSNKIANNLKKQLGPGGFPKFGSLAQQMTGLNQGVNESYSYVPKRELISINQSKDIPSE